SLSPNRNRLMYKVVGLGAFVSDLEGNTLSELGDVDAASWINQDEILYAISEDDGMETSSSRLVVQNLTNNDRILLKSSVEILENPSVNDKGNKIIANSPDGKMYLFTKQL
ncbi:MAG: hypothetical protein KI790_17710, partial [Cyclobacteriaceae bacterium]|nr:hypothetical protein [Cyclobacteriaceae bacterium HetDA_MAG_MS6]